MKIELLHSPKVHELIKTSWDLPIAKEGQFLVKTKYCGLCRNDIAAFEGTAFRMPLGREGHETLGTIVAMGSEYKGRFNIGDFVSTFDSDPGFGTHFHSDDTRAVKVPELSPKYILEPVACAVNILVKSVTSLINSNLDKGEDEPTVLLIGSGFMSLIIKQYCDYIGLKIEVAGKSHWKVWEALGANLKPFRFFIDKKETFDLIIDLGGTAREYPEYISLLAETSAIICLASTPKEELPFDFNTSAWKDLTYVFPSPRANGFLDIMNLCAKLIENKILDTSFLWSKSYKFDLIEECKQGFIDGLRRPNDYFKGYIEF